jgi:hypothetical protein
LKSSALAIAGKVAAIPGVYRLRESESRLVCIGTAQKALQRMFSVLQIALATDKIVSEDGHNWSVWSEVDFWVVGKVGEAGWAV